MVTKAQLEAENIRMRKRLERILELAKDGLDDPYRKLGAIKWNAEDALGLNQRVDGALKVVRMHECAQPR